MTSRTDRMHDFAAAARALVEGDMASVAEGRFSRTVFMSVAVRGSVAEATAYEVAGNRHLGVVTLEFGRRAISDGPRAVSVATPDGAGGHAVIHDCALVDADGGRCIIVPRGPGAGDRHFAIGPDGLEERAGRPSSLAAGMVRAARRLKAASRTADRSGARFSVVGLDQAA